MATLILIVVGVFSISSLFVPLTVGNVTEPFPFRVHFSFPPEHPRSCECRGTGWAARSESEVRSDRHDAARSDLILVLSPRPSSVYEYEAQDQTCKSAKPATASWGGDNPYLVDCHLEYDLSIMLSSLIQTDVYFTICVSG